MSDQYKVLIIDDVPQNIQIVATTLRDAGYAVMFATNGQEGILRAETTLPDVILLDIMMPGMDGYQVCQILKQHTILQTIPVIFLSALGDTDSIVQGFSLGAVDYISKPFNSPELLARVANHCHISSLKKLLDQKNRILEDVNASLELHVASRTHDLEKTLAQEKRFSTMTSSFLSLLAHEFRTPMTIIQSGVDIIQYLLEMPADKAKEQYERIRENISDSVSVITNHLDSISQMVETQTQLSEEQSTKVLMNAFLADSIEQFKRSYRPRHEINCHLPDTEIVAVIKLENFRMILTQILRNAIQYSPDDSTIDVCLQLEGGVVRVLVDDQGKGISSEESQYIYHLFKRGREQTQLGAHRGLGIGLTLCSWCIETLKGDIYFEPRGDVGTRFIVEITPDSVEVEPTRQHELV